MGKNWRETEMKEESKKGMGKIEKRQNWKKKERRKRKKKNGEIEERPNLNERERERENKKGTKKELDETVEELSTFGDIEGEG